MTPSYANQTVDGKQIRNALVGAIRTLYSLGPGCLQQKSIFSEVKKTLELLSDQDDQAVLDEWQVFLNEGLVAPGLNLSNPDLPYLHLTPKGLKEFSL